MICIDFTFLSKPRCLARYSVVTSDWPISYSSWKWLSQNLQRMDFTFSTFRHSYGPGWSSGFWDHGETRIFPKLIFYFYLLLVSYKLLVLPGLERIHFPKFWVRVSRTRWFFFTFSLIHMYSDLSRLSFIFSEANSWKSWGSVFFPK